MIIMAKDNQNNAAQKILEEQTHTINRHPGDIPAGEGLSKRNLFLQAYACLRLTVYAREREAHHAERAE
jgi:hypothetical protein